MQAVVLGRAVRWGTVLPRQCVELGLRVRVQDMRVLWLCARWAGISVTLSELKERRRAGGAGRPGRSGAVRRAAPPGLGRPQPSARLYGQELAVAAHSGAGAWWVGAGTVLAPFQPMRGSGEGLCSQKAQAAASQIPLPARPWFLRLPDPKKGLASSGFHGKLGMEGGGPWT